MHLVNVPQRPPALHFRLSVVGSLDWLHYTARRTALHATIAQWTTQLTPIDYNIEAVLDQLGNLAQILAKGTPGQQKRAINAVFESIDVGLNGEIRKAEPRAWFAPLFADLAAAMNGGLKCPQGSLGADQVATLLALVAIIPQPSPRPQA